MALSTASLNFRRVGAGQLYLVPAPTTGITTEEDYYKLFFGPTGTAAAAKKTLLAAVKPFATLDKSGLEYQIKPSKVAFDPNNNTKTDMVTGIDEATASCTFYEVDPPHLVDIFGSQAADLIQVAAAAGVAARNIAILGPQSYNTLYTALYRMPSSVVPGEFFHYIFPMLSIVPDLAVKMSKADAMSIKTAFQLMCSPFVFNSAGFGAVIITDDPTAPGL